MTCCNVNASNLFLTRWQEPPAQARCPGGTQISAQDCSRNRGCFRLLPLYEKIKNKKYSCFWLLPLYEKNKRKTNAAAFDSCRCKKKAAAVGSWRCIKKRKQYSCFRRLPLYAKKRKKTAAFGSCHCIKKRGKKKAAVDSCRCIYAIYSLSVHRTRHKRPWGAANDVCSP
jgi:hypothetical protein